MAAGERHLASITCLNISPDEDFSPKGVKFECSTWDHMRLNTNNVVIAFVAARALYKALGVLPSKQPDFNPETGVFSFPK